MSAYAKRWLPVALVCAVGLMIVATFFGNDMKEMFFSSSNSLRRSKQQTVAFAEGSGSATAKWRAGVGAGRFDTTGTTPSPSSNAEQESHGAAGVWRGYGDVMQDPAAIAQNSGGDDADGGSIPEDYEPEYPPPKARHMTSSGWPPKTAEAMRTFLANPSGNKSALERKEQQKALEENEPRRQADETRGEGTGPANEESPPPDAPAPSEPGELPKDLEPGKARSERQGVLLDEGRKRSPAENKQLAEKLTQEIRDWPLDDVVSFIRATTGMDVTIDASARNDRGEGGNRFSLDAREVPLTTALKRMLEAEGLAYTVIDGKVVIAAADSEVLRNAASSHRPPQRYLPRSAYFENTYLGGNAAIAERQRRLDRAWGQGCPYRLAALGPQAFDPPPSDGLALACSLDRTWQEKPGRVMLQIGIRGSDRYGWRRPPLDVMCVIDPAVLAAARGQVDLIMVALVRQLGPQDKLGLVLASSPPRVLAPPQRLREIKASLAEHLAQLPATSESSPADLATALELAGERLASGSGTGVPGTQTVLLIAGPAAEDRVDAARQAAHGLSLAGIVTSVLEVGGQHESEWWSVAHAGQGNHHQVAGAQVDAAVATELASLARVVARLARVNIRLGPDTKAVRILGSRILAAPEVQEVKAREVATDRQLSRTLGVASDRGEDDDGLQTVIPYFLGGDAHVILVELEVAKPGTVAEISVRYKDMVRLTNAQVRATVSLGPTPRPTTRQETEVMRNAARFAVAERLRWAAIELARGNVGNARGHLAWAAGAIPRGAPERRMVDELGARAAAEGAAARVIDAVGLAAERMVGVSEGISD